MKRACVPTRVCRIKKTRCGGKAPNDVPKNQLHRVDMLGLSRHREFFDAAAAAAFCWINSIGSSRGRNFCATRRKTCWPFLFLRRTHRQVFNFYNEPPCRLWSRRVASSGDFLCHKPRRSRTRGEPAILTNFPRELVPGVRFLKDQRRGARSATGSARWPLAKFNIGARPAPSWNF